MLRAPELARTISFAFNAHNALPTKPSKAARKWDGKTPYGIHPTWCAMTILTETTLPEETRNTGAIALLLHDVLEDTTVGLPEGTPIKVHELVSEMTFANSDEEMEQIWSKPTEVKLLKLYDKVSNLLDASWMTEEKRARYSAYLARLCNEVEPWYGKNLNIIRIARAITA